MSTGFTPGLRNQVVLGSAVLPVLQGSSFSMPKNLAIPQVFSGNNLFQFNSVEGLRYPVVNLNTLLTKEWFTAANLTKWFLTRTGDDVPTAGALQYWDGASGVSVPACKLNMLSIGGSYGDLMRVRMTILGYGTPSALTSKPSSSVIESTPASFFHVSASGGLSTTKDAANAFSSFDIVLSNNLDVEPELAATNYAQEINSGQLTGTMRLVMQAKRTPPADGTECSFTITPPGGTPVTITVLNPESLDPEERAVQFPRQMRERNFVLKGDGGPDQPIVSFA